MTHTLRAVRAGDGNRPGTVSLGAGLSYLSDRDVPGQSPSLVVRECPPSTRLHPSIGHAMAGHVGNDHRSVDLLLTMSIPDRCSTVAMLVRAGFVVVLVPVNVFGFRSVLAHGWHESRLGHAARPALVGELHLAVLGPAVFSKSPDELRFLFSTLLTGSRGLWCSCALDVPFALLARARQSRRLYRRPRLASKFLHDLGRCTSVSTRAQVRPTYIPGGVDEDCVGRAG
jgi:hypothetical protein